MNILITGSSGFVGKNICAIMAYSEQFNLVTFTKENSIWDLKKKILTADAIIHLAATNRSSLKSDFERTNYKLTNILCNYVTESKKKIPIIFISSIHDNLNIPYGLSKKKTINFLKKFSTTCKNPILIIRLSRVFGKWARPFYNSVVATFIKAVHDNKDVIIKNKNKNLKLIYIEDIVYKIQDYLLNKKKLFEICNLTGVYNITTKNLYKKIIEIKKKDLKNDFSNFGNKKNVDSYLYSTYISYLSSNNIKKKLIKKTDKRGSFVEILKTKNDGQFSYFTCKPKEVRGQHFHNFKLEKFLVIKGRAEFRMRNINSDKIIKTILDEKNPELVVSIPGHTHEIENIGKDELIVFVWVNEVFDKNNPDTYKLEL